MLDDRLLTLSWGLALLTTMVVLVALGVPPALVMPLAARLPRLGEHVPRRLPARPRNAVDPASREQGQLSGREG
jgi:hypothetical protein